MAGPWVREAQDGMREVESPEGITGASRGDQEREDQSKTRGRWDHTALHGEMGPRQQGRLCCVGLGCCGLHVDTVLGWDGGPPAPAGSLVSQAPASLPVGFRPWAPDTLLAPWLLPPSALRTASQEPGFTDPFLISRTQVLDKCLWNEGESKSLYEK